MGTKNILEYRKEKGQLTTSDRYEAEQLAQKGYDVKIEDEESLEESDIDVSAVSAKPFTKEQIKLIAKEAGKAIVDTFRFHTESGISRAIAKNIDEQAQSFTIEIRTPKKNNVPGNIVSYIFTIKDTALYYDNNKISDIGLDPAGTPQIQQVLVQRAFSDYYKNLNELKQDIFLTYAEILSEVARPLPTASEEILDKFPKLKETLVNLHTEEFDNFVDSVDWISPKPSAFRVNLTNGKDYSLKWLGDVNGWEAEIQGKTYMISITEDFQKALEKLGEIYKETPLEYGLEDEENFDDLEGSDGGGPGGGGGPPGGGGPAGPADRPGGGGEPSLDDLPPLEDVPIDFEEPQQK